MKTIDDINFSGKRAIMRVDFNVPLNQEFQVRDNTRIKAAIPSIKKILDDGGAVVLMSHLGRPKSGPEEKFSLKHIVPELENLLGKSVQFAENCIGIKAKELSAGLKAGEVLLLENLRFHQHEQAGTESFAKELSNHGDVYVNDAFGTAHRAHASTTIIARFFPDSKVFGYLIKNEIESIQRVLEKPEKPVTAILGGAKVSGKINIIEQLIPKVDNLIIGGGMAYTFAKALGGNIGSSLVEEQNIQIALDVMKRAKENDCHVYLPTDSAIADEFSNEANIDECSIKEIPEGWMGLDIGTKSIEQFIEVILASKSILWNGPMGVFEMSNFEKGTLKIAEAVVEATEKGAFSVIGGGDSVAAINKFGWADRVSFVSTGGGAMLEYLEGKSLPGIEAILK